MLGDSPFPKDKSGWGIDSDNNGQTEGGFYPVSSGDWIELYGGIGYTTQANNRAAHLGPFADSELPRHPDTGQFVRRMGR